MNKLETPNIKKERLLQSITVSRPDFLSDNKAVSVGEDDNFLGSRRTKYSNIDQVKDVIKMEDQQKKFHSCYFLSPESVKTPHHQSQSTSIVNAMDYKHVYEPKSILELYRQGKAISKHADERTSLGNRPPVRFMAVSSTAALKNKTSEELQGAIKPDSHFW